MTHDEMRANLDRIQEYDRPLPWVVHTGCSYRRIASETTRENLRSFPDGNVLHAQRQYDGCLDLSMGERELVALVEIINAVPTLLADLAAKDARLAVMREAMEDAVTQAFIEGAEWQKQGRPGRFSDVTKALRAALADQPRPTEALELECHICGVGYPCRCKPTADQPTGDE